MKARRAHQSRRNKWLAAFRGGPFLWLLCAAAACGPGTIGDNVPGMASLVVLEPAESAVVSGMVNIHLTLLGDVDYTRISRVDVAVDDAVVAQLAPMPNMVHPINTLGLGDGIHTITGTLYFIDGTAAVTTSGFRVDNSPPELIVDSPVGDSIFFEDGPIAFRVTAGDEPLQSLTLSVNGTLAHQVMNAAPGPQETILDPMMLSPTMMPVEVALAAQGIDTAGNVGSITKTVLVQQREVWFSTEDESRYGPVILADGAVALATADGLTIFEPDGMVRCRASGANEAAPLVYIPPNNAIFWSTLTEFFIVSGADCSVMHSEATPGGTAITGVAFQTATVYATTFEGSLRTFMTDGTPIETISLADAVVDPGTLEIARAIGVSPNGTVYVGGSLNSSTGAFFTIRPGMPPEYRRMPAPLTEGLLAQDNGAYVGAGDGRLYRINSALERWREEPELSPANPIECTPVAFDTDTIVVCDGDGKLWGVSTENGEPEWEFDVAGSRPSTRLIGTAGIAISPDGQLLALGDRLGTLHVFQRAGDRLALRWKADISTMMTPITGIPALNSERIYVSGSNGLVVAYNL